MIRMVGFIWIALGASLGIWFAAMSMDNQIPYDYLADGATLAPNPASEGSQVMLHWPIKMHRICPGSVVRSLHFPGRTPFTYDPTISSLTVKLGDTEVNKVFQLPPGLPHGETEYTARVCFQCNFLQRLIPDRLCVQTPTLHFTIKP